MGTRPSIPTTELNTETMKMLSKAVGCSVEYVQNWHKMFLIVAPDGRLKKKKFIEIYQHYFPGVDVKRLAKLIFKYFDTDKSKWISFNELFIPNALYNSQDPKVRAMAIFHICDSDRNGRVTLKELTKLVGALYELYGITDKSGVMSPANKASQIIQRIDFNHDTTIDETEFMYAMMSDPYIPYILSFNYSTPLQQMTTAR